jgi:FkbM family methyltransferase
MTTSTIQRIANRGIAAMGVAAGRALERRMRRAHGLRYATRRIYGRPMLLDMEDPGLSRGLMLFGERELDMKRMLELFVRPAMRIYDIGGNIGYYPLLDLHLLSAGGELIVVEPVPGNVALLKKNLALNGYSAVTVIQGAVSSVASKRAFYVSEHSNLGTFHPEGTVRDYLNGSTIDVDTVTVPLLAERYGGPDLIRMDIEGHEVEVLDNLRHGGEAGLYAPVIVFETHPDRYGAEHDMAGVLRKLFSLGYSARLVSSLSDEASQWFIQRNYKPVERIATDAEHRTLFRDLTKEHASTAICSTGLVRTVVLAKGEARDAGSTGPRVLA